MKSSIYNLVFVFAAALSLAACSEAKEAYNCADICNAYQECIDEEFDVTQCTTECERKSDEEPEFASKAAECETCLDERSCVETFPCVDECVGVVP